MRDRTAYNRAYYAANRERLLQKQWERDRKRVKYKREYRRLHSEQCSAYWREWHARNRDALKVARNLDIGVPAARQLLGVPA